MTEPPPPDPSVRRFFDRLAPHYDQRYGPRRPYLAWLFAERQRRATHGLPLAGAAVLDVGAGTGALYRYLHQQGIAVDYYGADLSAEMLRHSAIPPGRRFAGRLPDLDLPRDSFDFIFLLGVTTYLPPAELAAYLRFIARHLAPAGQAVLHFTNRRSLDWRLRRLAQPIARLLGRGVLAQPFPTFAYTPAEVAGLMPPTLPLSRFEYFNPLIPPLERFAPRAWTAIARRLDRARQETAWRPWLCADFLTWLSRRD